MGGTPGDGRWERAKESQQEEAIASDSLLSDRKVEKEEERSDLQKEAGKDSLASKLL